MNEPDFSKYAELTTERLQLKHVVEDDAPGLFEIRSNPEVNEFLNRKSAESVEEVKTFIRKINELISRSESIYWAIRLKGNTKIAGTICLWNREKDKSKAEIGFELLPEFQNRGIISEAIPPVLKFGKEIMKLKELRALPGN